MKIIKKQQKEKDFYVPVYGLGDIWRLFSWANHHYSGYSINIITKDSQKLVVEKKIKDFLLNTKNNLRLKNIHTLEDGYKKPKLINAHKVGHFEYCDTIIPWSPVGRKVCIKLDSAVSKRKYKNFTDKQIKEFFNFFKMRNFDIFIPSGDMSVRKNIKHMSECSLFVGIDSGFSHISHNLKMPSFIIYNKMIKEKVEPWHRYSNSILLKDFNELSHNLEIYSITK